MSCPLHILLVVHVDTGFGRGVLRGVARYAREHPEQPFHWERIPISWGCRTLREGRAQGMIANFCEPALVKAAIDSGLPMVNIADSLPDVPLPQVICDNDAIGRLAAEHFLERGLTQFAYMGLDGWGFSERRGAAFRRVVEQAGCVCHFYPPDERLRTRWIWRERAKRFERWLTSLPRPVAVFACNDTAARQLAEAALRLGLRIPEDVAVLGVDNDEVECELAGVPISSIAVGARQIGHQAAALLTRLLRGEPAPQQPLLVPPQGVLVRRSSDYFAVEDAELRNALRFIHEHVGDGIKVTDVLQVVPVSRRDLERRFARLLGRTPHEEIRRAQIQRAKRLLAETALPMSRIAAATGLKEPKRLSTVFRSQTGLSPTEYRRRHQSH